MTKVDQSYQREYRRYAVGLIVALCLIYASYLITTQRVLEGTVFAGVLLLIAITQLIVQMVLFLHIFDESKPRWTLWSMSYSIIMTTIVVVGSLWVMYNLNYNMHISPEQMKQYMIDQNKKGF